MRTPTGVAASKPLTALRRDTHSLHARLDECFDAGDWLGDLDTYADYLRRIGACHRAIERCLLGRSFVDHTGFAPKSVLADLDLAALARPRIPAPSAATATPPGSAAALGALYVVEGSTLGGRVIAQRVGRELPDAVAATRFLRSYGAETTARWRTTLGALAATTEPVAEIVAGARWAFELFTDALLPVGSP